MALKVILNSPFAKIPRRANANDAGYDLSSAEVVSIQPGERKIVDTGIIVRVPEGTYGRVAPRSGLAAKYGIDCLAGVIDRGYSANVKVILLNTGSAVFDIKIGDRIAQLVLEKIETPNVEVVTSLDSTERGLGGFGSTGV